MEKAQYAIMRFAKYKGPEIGNIEAHNERTKEILQLSQGGVVHGAVLLLAVAGDEGDGVALVEQMHDVFNVPGVFAELGSKGLNEIHKMFLSYIGRRSGAVK